MSVLNRSLTTVAGLACGLSLSTGAAADDLKMYMVGNSLTDEMRVDQLAEIAEGQGHSLDVGQHLIWGAALNWTWENLTNPSEVSKNTGRFGLVEPALTGYAFDVISLQPYARPLEVTFEPGGPPRGDLVHAMNFIDLAMTNQANADARYLIFQHQPVKKVTGQGPAPDRVELYDLPGSEPDFDAWWNDRPYTGDWDASYDTSQYAYLLRDGIEEAYAARTEGAVPNKPIEVVPVGDVYSRLHNLLRADGLELSFRGKDESDLTPDTKSAWDLYEDHVHPTEVGEYAAAMSYYAVLFGKLPGDLPAGDYDVTDEERDAVQAAVRSVVFGNPWEGDTNLDGVVNQTDLDALVAHWGQGGVSWQMGDFDASNVIDRLDLENVLGQWTPGFDDPILPAFLVPEPASGLALGLLVLAGRRRR